MFYIVKQNAGIHVYSAQKRCWPTTHNITLIIHWQLWLLLDISVVWSCVCIGHTSVYWKLPHQVMQIPKICCLFYNKAVMKWIFTHVLAYITTFIWRATEKSDCCNSNRIKTGSSILSSITSLLLSIINY